MVMRQDCISAWPFLGVSIFNTVLHLSGFLSLDLLHSPSSSFFTSVSSPFSGRTPPLPSSYLPLDTYLEPSSPGPLSLHPLPLMPQGSCGAWQGAEGDGLRPVGAPPSPPPGELLLGAAAVKRMFSHVMYQKKVSSLPSA